MTNQEYYIQNKIDTLLNADANNIVNVWEGTDSIDEYNKLNAFLNSETYIEEKILMSLKDGKESTSGYMTNDLYNYKGTKVVFSPGMPDSFYYIKGKL